MLAGLLVFVKCKTIAFSVDVSISGGEYPSKKCLESTSSVSLRFSSWSYYSSGMFIFGALYEYDENDILTAPFSVNNTFYGFNTR